MIAYNDRSVILGNEYNKKVMSVNGIFYPVILDKGKVVGTWKRAFEKEAALIRPAFFKTSDKINGPNLKTSAKAYGNFLQMQVKILNDINKKPRD